MIVNVVLCLALGATSCALRSAPPEPLRVGGSISPPEKTRNVNPEYPPAARAEQITGVVIIEIVVGPDGRVAESEVVRSVEGLDEAALA